MDIKIKNPLCIVQKGSAEVLPVYTGAYRKLNVSLISFTIDGTSYNSEEGMTWEEWCSSNYNTYGYVADSYYGYVSAGGGHDYVAFSGSLVRITDVIINNKNYTHHDVGTGGGN